MINTRYDPHRRSVLLVGSGLLLTAVFPWRAQAAEIEIAMAGTPSGSQVWFQPRGLWIQPGQTVRIRFFRARHLLRKSLAFDIDVIAHDAFAFDGERCNRLVHQTLLKAKKRHLV